MGCFYRDTRVVKSVCTGNSGVRLHDKPVTQTEGEIALRRIKNNN